MESELPNNNPMAESEKSGMLKPAMTYGLYYALVAILLTIAFYATGNITSKVNQWGSIAIMIAAVVIIQLAYRKSLGGWMTYGQGLGIAVLSLLFAGIVIAVFTYVLYKFIDPGLIDQVRLATEEQLYRSGMQDAQIDATMAVSSKFQTPAIISVMSIVNMAFIGLIIGAITAIFTKRPNPGPAF